MPADTRGRVIIVDFHLLHWKAIPSGQGIARSAIERVRNDVRTATGVDLVLDVDKLALTPGVTVVRGRFDGEKMAEKLGPYKYVPAEYSGRHYLVRTGDDALLIVDDHVLVYGDENGIKAAIDAKGGRIRSAKDERVKGRLAQMGWDEPLLATIQFNDDRPSLRAMITGATGSRAVTVGIRTARGVDVHATIEASSPNGAQELAKTLEERRAHTAESLATFAGADLAALLGNIARGAAIQVDAAHGQVDVRAHVSGDELDGIVKAATTSSTLAETYKSLRQLLAPGP